MSGVAPGTRAEVRASRRRLVADGLGIAVSTGAFGLVYGLAARQAGFSLLAAMAASVVVLAGASQFAAVGMVAQGVPWIAILPLTAMLNARHLLYSAALGPWLRDRPGIQRVAMAHVLTDETFALSLPHFRRIGRADGPGYWLASSFVVGPWIVATGLGYLASGAVPDPTRIGLDVVFPAAMGGLAVALVSQRRELVAAVVAAGLAVGVSLVSDPAVGIVVGGVVGPLVALAVPPGRDARPLGGSPGSLGGSPGSGPPRAGEDPTIGVAL